MDSARCNFYINRDTNTEKLFLILNDTPWENNLKKARYYISMGLSNYHKVLFVSLPPDRQNIKLKDLITRIVPKIRRIKRNLFIYGWPCWTLEIYRIPSIMQCINNVKFYLLKNIVQKLVGASNHQIIAYFTHPSMFHFFGLFEKAIKIYNPFDKFDVMGNQHNAHVEYLEHKYGPQFDFILCPSQQMVGYFKQLNDNTIFFPHGVDFELYSKATKNETAVPKEILSIKKPIIGYTGIINDRIDLGLLQDILKNKYAWSIVMIGPIKLYDENKKMFDILMKMPSFHWLGYQEPDLLPNFMKYIDVGIIPYRLKNLVKWSSNPLKLHMYTAAGLPTVSSKLGNVEKVYDTTYVASGLNEWIARIQEALKEEKKEDLRKRRLSLASENDWSTRVEFLVDLVNSF